MFYHVDLEPPERIKSGIEQNPPKKGSSRENSEPPPLPPPTFWPPSVPLVFGLKV